MFLARVRRSCGQTVRKTRREFPGFGSVKSDVSGSAQAGQSVPSSHLAGLHCCAAAGADRLLQMTGSLQGAIMMASAFIPCSKWINHSKWASPPNWKLLGSSCPDTNIYPAHGGSARNILQPGTPALQHKPGAGWHRGHRCSARGGLGSG